jgi:acyl-CoA synthetase (AMP-forming)/AMP-acid ligase II
MVPRNIRLLNQFPLNANGKFDRGALRKKLELSR